MADDWGASALYEISKQLKQSDKNMRKVFHKSIRESGKQLLRPIRGSAESRFPSRGGLNTHMARSSRYRTVVRTGADTAGVSIRANRTDPRADTQGRIAHPVPQVGGTRVAAHTVTSTSLKTRKTRTRKVAAAQVGGEFVRDAKGRKVMVVQRFPEAVGFFRDPIEARAELVRRDLLDALERWADERGLR